MHDTWQNKTAKYRQYEWQRVGSKLKLLLYLPDTYESCVCLLTLLQATVKYTHYCLTLVYLIGKSFFSQSHFQFIQSIRLRFCEACGRTIHFSPTVFRFVCLFSSSLIEPWVNFGRFYSLSFKVHTKMQVPPLAPSQNRREKDSKNKINQE